MDNCWNRDYRDRIIRFFEPVTGPIVTEYLHNADGSVGLELLRGRADYVTFVDRGRIAKYEFNLYVRTNGRDTASRKKAIDTLMAAANRCLTAIPFENAYIEITGFPYLFNRNMSGNEEYRAEFALIFRVDADPRPLKDENAETEGTV